VAIFSRTVFKSTVFNTDSVLDTHDGAGYTPEEYRKYRKILERMYKASEARYSKPIVKKAKTVLDIAKKLEVNDKLKLPTVTDIANTNEPKKSELDYTSIQNELRYVINYIDTLIVISNRKKVQEQEAEFLILCLV
jgi:hypothetical protein